MILSVVTLTSCHYLVTLMSVAIGSIAENKQKRKKKRFLLGKLSQSLLTQIKALYVIGNVIKGIMPFYRIERILLTDKCVTYANSYKLDYRKFVTCKWARENQQNEMSWYSSAQGYIKIQIASSYGALINWNTNLSLFLSSTEWIIDSRQVVSAQYTPAHTKCREKWRKHTQNAIETTDFGKSLRMKEKEGVRETKKRREKKTIYNTCPWSERA